jgi:hypothetical protein
VKGLRLRVCLRIEVCRAVDVRSTFGLLQLRKWGLLSNAQVTERKESRGIDDETVMELVRSCCCDLYSDSRCVVRSVAIDLSAGTSSRRAVRHG